MFRERIRFEKDTKYPLKLFMLIPFASPSCRKWCKSKHITLAECKNAYYPSDSPRMGHLKDFFEEYREAMHVANLEVISYPSPNDLPVKPVTQALQNNASKMKIVR